MPEHDYAAALGELPRRRDQLLPALHAVHALAGWLPEAAIEAAARHVYLPLSEVYGIVTSYSEFRLTPPDPDRIEVCTGLTCLMAGAEAIIAAQPAGAHVERVPCRFLCAVAPVVERGGAYAGRATPGATPRSAPPWAAPARTSLPSMGDVAPPLAARREQAVERLHALASRTRIAVADGVCSRATGAGRAVDAALLAGAQGSGAPPFLVRVGCDGACHAGPTVTIRTPDGRAHRVERADNAGVRSALSAMRGPAELSQVESPAARRVLRNCGVIDPENLDEALAAGAYLGLERALAMTPEDVVALVRAAGLRGRGGAYFPTATKWEAARAFSGPRSLVVNAEEGEPGVLKDRHLMEGDPHALVEGALIAAYAVGAERIYLYVNGQAALAFARVARAMADARAAGLVGADVLGSNFTCTIELYRGAGGYVCGEESVILNSIEGERAVPRLRPPFPTEAGLWGRPTVINNVETLVNLPLILTEGVDWFRALGTADFPGTKLMSVSGAVARPGLIEAPLGISVGAVLATAGGAQPGHTLTAAVVGGPSGGLLPASLFDLPLVGGMLHPSGPVLGAGGIVALDERTSVAAALRELTAYNRAESCGKCTPCREGTARALDMLDAGAALTAADRRALLDLCDVMQTASLCGLGQMAPGPIRSALTLFP